MRRQTLTRALRWSIPTVLFAAACGSDAKTTDGQARDSAAGAAAGSSPSASSPASSASASGAANTPAELTSANLDAYARGIAKEIEMVKAAQERARTATTPQARGEASQAQWEDQTIPGGAQSAGLAAEEYRQVRRTVHQVLQTLDFQGKIDGPMQMDTAHATPEMKKQLTTDPFEELSASSRTVLRDRMDKLVPLWVQYVSLTAVAG